MWFSSLRQKFAKQSTTKKLTQDKQIQLLLSRIKNSRAHLTVKVKDKIGGDHEFASYLLKFDRQTSKTRLVFDELFPTTGNKYVKIGTVFDVHVASNGVTIEFSVPVVHIQMDRGSPLYFCGYPTDLAHTQQRKAYRVQVNSQRRYPVMLMSDNRSPIKGVLADVSTTGMRIESSQDIKPAIQTGEVMQNCYITISKGNTLEFGAQVKHIGANRLDSKRFIGLQFTKFKNNGDRHISKLVVDLQMPSKK